VPGEFTLSRGGVSGQITVYYTVTGTAAAGSDYTTLSGSVVVPNGVFSVKIPMTPINDSAPERSETVIVTLSSNADYIINPPSQATVTIVDNDGWTSPTATISAAADAYEKPLAAGRFTVQKTNGSEGDVALTVYYTVSGTATVVNDYAALSGSVSLPVGVSSADITVTPVDDLIIENAETVIATISANADYIVGSPSVATVNIISDDAPGDPNMVSRWPLDESSGLTAFDVTGNGHDGTCSATDWAPAGGKYNGAALFDTTSDYISVPTTGMNYNAVSISLWVNPTVDADNAWFFGHTSVPTDLAINRLQIKTSPATVGVNPLRIATPNSSHLIAGLPLMTPNTWFHIVLTLSGTSGAGTAICYVNGAQAGTGAYSGFTALAATAHIGNDDMGAPTHGAKAYIDDVRIYKKALSLSEVQAIYSGN